MSQMLIRQAGTVRLPVFLSDSLKEPTQKSYLFMIRTGLT